MRKFTWNTPELPRCHSNVETAVENRHKVELVQMILTFKVRIAH